MKRHIALSVFLLLLAFSISGQENNLVLVHPTKYNLELFFNLIDKKIVNLEGINILGIYHQEENYDYEKSKAFIAENNYTNIVIKGVEKELDPNKLYETNNCSDIYAQLFKYSIGIIFFGGPDLPPSIYNEQMSLLTQMTDPYRHYFEISFLFHLLGGSQNPDFKPLLDKNPNYPVYAICLGMQTMNVAAGGTMIQDIPSEVYGLNLVEEVLETDNNKQHRNYNNNLVIDSTLFSGNFHQIKIINPKPLAGDYNENPTPLIYSNHHQAIEKLGMNLKVIATSMDGKIIEAIAHEKYPNVLGIQFHPEGIYLHDAEMKYHKNPGDELKSGKQILIDNNSYRFHLELWETFSNKLIHNK